MEVLADTLRQVELTLGAAVGRAYRSGELRGMGDDAVLTLVRGASVIARQAEALMVGAVAELEERGEVAAYPERPTTRFGCRSVKELVQRTTLGSGRMAGDVVRAARAVQQPVAVSTGEVLPAAYPALREAAADGVVGLEALAAVVGTLTAAQCDRGARFVADAELAASARGVGVDGGPCPGVDDLRLQAQVWAAYLDQDGAEPRESRALRKRAFTIGVCRDGMVPCRGILLPEVAAQLQRLFDSILNPKTGGPDVPAGPWFADRGDPGADTIFKDAALEDPALGDATDPRTRVMRQHDALAMVLTVAARSGAVPSVGGAAPTLVVSVTAEDLVSGRGHAHLDGCNEPVSLAVARQVACTGGVQRVTSDKGGRIVGIGIIDRVFAAHQRRAITLRDGGCLIPGCHVPPAWCEIHHVTEHSRGGPTHTDNGVLLCWWHHRTLDSNGWKIRTNNGIPEVRGPSAWDPGRQWRTVTTSPTRLSRALRARSPG
ncbi:DUF222 domain-containing protein [Microbacterium sp. P02]|uniref:HNH endonuclease signature motif containing protein n=1 Tax=Microbacterium sp. P02 TaxID=3366260 RepID=UPI00366A5677